ncbi:MAG: hypothetical protein FJ255_00180 [Phycisphaerae bacterium]|nr:hypothetical protein [Phycisphaerae bacterium]
MAHARPDKPDLLVMAALAGVFAVALGSAVLSPAVSLDWAIAATALIGAAALFASIRERRRERGRIDEGVRTILGRLGGSAASGAPAGETLARCVRLLDAALSADRARGGLAAAVLRGVGEPVIATDRNGRVTLFNPAGADLCAPRPPAAGDPLDALFASRELLDLHAAALRGEPGRAQARLAVRGGTRTFQVGAAPLEDGGAVLTLRDVTDVAAAAQLKTDFVANASHELRTPLASIRAAVETLGDQARDDPAAAEWLMGKIVGNLDRLDDLTRDLLDLSRIESPEAVVRIVPARASAIVASASADVQPALARRRLTLALDLDPALERLRTDPGLVALILKNLLDNAAKFAFEGTEVRLVGRRTPAGARFEVVDRGVGIPLEHQARVFERFYQVDEARAGGAERGTGLGLAIVKHAAKALGGTVGLESVWQRGTTAWVEIPDGVEA